MISGSFGIAIVMTQLLTITICGPLAVNISGSMKDVFLTYIGFIFFENVNATPAILCGLTFSFSGAAFYSYDRFKNSQAQAVEPKKGDKDDASKKA